MSGNGPGGMASEQGTPSGLPSNRKRVVEPPPDPAPISCTICTDFFKGPDDPTHIKPCPRCDNDYCLDCVERMFTTALEQPDLMPARCCAPLQLFTVVSSLPDAVAQRYRDKFAEWLLPNKLYCPVPTCSAFIHEKHVPFHQTRPQKSLKDHLVKILGKVRNADASRFFRTGQPQSDLPNYKEMIANPIDLEAIEARIKAPGEITTEEFIGDFDLLLMNAVHYNNSPDHPVAEAARKCQEIARTEVNRTVNGLAHEKDIASIQQKVFACPVCHIAICASCHNIAHEGECDHTADDKLLKVLQSYGYKQCPRCRQALKKMYGCPHIECKCGAHFCYMCLRSIDDCPGGCGVDEHDDEEDDEEFGEANEAEQPVELVTPQLPLSFDATSGSQSQRPIVTAANNAPTVAVDGTGFPYPRRGGDPRHPPIPPIREIMNETTSGAASRTNRPSGSANRLSEPNAPMSVNHDPHVTEPTPVNLDPSVPSTSSIPELRRHSMNDPAPRPHITNESANTRVDSISQMPVNLDAGGARRWAEAAEDFGDEPEEGHHQQIWSCRHDFDVFEPKFDGHRRGEFARMECNRCGTHLVANFASSSQVGRRESKQRKVEDPVGSPIEGVAMECYVCTLIVCKACKERYQAEEERKRRKKP